MIVTHDCLVVFVSFNRTSMELKPAAAKTLSEALTAFNRTSMELKHSTQVSCPSSAGESFNRTSMELKRAQRTHNPCDVVSF